ncbi:MAG: thioredoxin domain-containing protein, partial [Bacteroidota bacterium]
GHLAHNFDTEKGGNKRPPKFPMPSIWSMLLRYYHASHTHAALDQLVLTLDRMGMGGIYDVVGGGFARYSVDDAWHVPHFEKMLYDNGQLLALYSDAYRVTQKGLYKDIVYDTVSWLERELTSEEGGFFSALDADSEGMEGRYYIYTIDELLEALDEEDVAFLKQHFQVKNIGNWEDGWNVLIRTEDDAALASKVGTTEAEMREYLRGLWAKLLDYRSPRERPGLDDKILTGWNGLMLKGLVEAYGAFAEPRFLELALSNAAFIESHLREGNAHYRTYKNGKASLKGYLEDYAAVIDGYLALHQATFEERWLTQAQNLTSYVLENFLDEQEGFFFFTDATGEALITRKKELFDNVIPASNSIMAHNLFTLGVITGSQQYTTLAESLMGPMQKLVMEHPRDLAHWASLLIRYYQPTAEIAIVGPEAQAFRMELQKHYLPDAVVVGTETESDLPLLEDRVAINGKTTLYVCFNRACQLPVHSVAEALDQLQDSRKS